MSDKDITIMNGICVLLHISSLNFHRMCVQSIYTFWYIDMSDVTANYGTIEFIIAFLHIFLDYCVFANFVNNWCVWSVVSSPNFHRLCIWSMYLFWYVKIQDLNFFELSNIFKYFVLEEKQNKRTSVFTSDVPSYLNTWQLNIKRLIQKNWSSSYFRFPHMCVVDHFLKNCLMISHFWDL